MISRLAGLTLVLLFGMGNIAYSNEASGTGSNDTSKSCEDGATNMAEIYECLDKKRNAQLTHVFNELSEQLLSVGLSDKLQFLQSSQNAWTADTKLYCHTLLQIARPKWGPYAQDIQNNCRTELTNRRIQDLSLLLGALVEENFEYWK